ncbi:MAG: hypothetical protein Q7J73_00640 [Dehalococcoidales bacterium]|nr:hypothetical protein [Dehalococcoidales bacterium]
MNTYRIEADATFEAESLDDALLVLSVHFKTLYDGIEDITTVKTGTISVGRNLLPDKVGRTQ